MDSNDARAELHRRILQRLGEPATITSWRSATFSSFTARGMVRGVGHRYRALDQLEFPRTQSTYLAMASHHCRSVTSIATQPRWLRRWRLFHQTHSYWPLIRRSSDFAGGCPRRPIAHLMFIAAFALEAGESVNGFLRSAPRHGRTRQHHGADR